MTRAIEQLRRRVRSQRAARSASHSAVIALSLLGPALLYTKLEPLGRTVQLQLLAAAAVVVGLAALVAAARPVAALPIACAIERAGRLADLIASGWEFSQRPLADRTPFMRATIAAAETRANAVARADVSPWRWPASVFALPWLAIGIACLWNLKAPQPSAAKAIAPERPVRLLSRLDLNAERKAFRRTLPSADARLQAIDASYDDLLDRIERGQIDRIALLRALSDLEARLSAASEHSRDADAALTALGRALSESALTEPLGAALSHDDLAAARAALQAMAARVHPPSHPRDLESLRAALRRALSKQEQTRQVKMAEARRELDLLRKRSGQSGGGTANPPASNKRELDRLDRDEAARAGSAPLESELSRAADGGGEPDQTPRELEHAADRLSRMEQDAVHDRALERMREQLEDLRQQLADSPTPSQEPPRSPERSAGGQPSPSSNDRAGSPPPSAAGGSGGSQPLDVSEFRRRAGGTQTESGGKSKPTGEHGQPSGLIVEHTPPPSAASGDRLIGRQFGSPESAPGREGRVQKGVSTPS
ncbi:MAG TPA: hypothetical protein VHZ95_19195, partial [Polyangiales bacterium]|nr:hypothetical protein [Polyangiales bacterium]